MQSDTSLTLPAVMLGLTWLTALVEHSLYGGMNRVYYSHGIPLIARRIRVGDSQRAIPPLTAAAGQFRSFLIGSLVFVQIAPNIFGFRRQFFQWALFPDNLVHGMLLFDRENDQVVLKCFLNAWVLLLVLAGGAFVLLGAFPWWGRLLPLFIIFLIIVPSLLLERHRCQELARFAAAAWSGPAGGAEGR